MEDKAKTYLESGVLLIISAICAYFTKTLHFMTYTNSIFGVVLLILSFRMKMKAEDAEEDGDAAASLQEPAADSAEPAQASAGQEDEQE